MGGRVVGSVIEVIVPYSVTWALEHAEPDPDRHDFPVLASLAELPPCIDALDAPG